MASFKEKKRFLTNENTNERKYKLVNELTSFKIKESINGNKRTGTCTKLGTVNLRKKMEQKQTDKGLGH